MRCCGPTWKPAGERFPRPEATFGPDNRRSGRQLNSCQQPGNFSDAYNHPKTASFRLPGQPREASCTGDGKHMSTWMVNGMLTVLFLAASTGLFFFVVTRGALLVRGLSPGQASEKSHVYPIYSNMRLIKLVDFQPIISAILLFQYHHLVSKIVSDLEQLDLRSRKVL